MQIYPTSTPHRPVSAWARGHRSQGRAESPPRAVHRTRRGDWRFLRAQTEVVEQFRFGGFDEVSREISFDLGVGGGRKRSQDLPVDSFAGRDITGFHILVAHQQVEPPGQLPDEALAFLQLDVVLFDKGSAAFSSRRPVATGQYAQF